MQSKSTAFTALAFTILTWGVSPVFVRSLALASGPADSTVIRMCFVALVCLPLLIYTGLTIARTDVPRLLVLGVIGMFGYFLGAIFGYAHLTAGLGGILIGTQPLIIALLAAAFGHEKLTASIIAGLIISFCGTLLLFGGDTGANLSSSELILGSLMIFACSICWSIYVVFSKPLVQKYGSLKITLWSLILCAPPALLFSSNTTLAALYSLTLPNWEALFFLSVVATIIAVTLWNYAAAQMPASLIGASLYLVPVLAVASGWLILGETISLRTLLAGFVIMLGVAVAEFGKSFLTERKKV